MPGANGNVPKAYLGGAWKDWNAVQGNLSGTWRLASDVYVKDGGTWKQVWVRLTAPTGGSSSISHVTATISWTAGVGQEGFKLYRNGTFVKNVAANETSTTDPVPAMQTNYAYTVSAYAGATETAQISCGTVSAQVGTTTASASIVTDWGYVNDSWNGAQIVFNTSCAAVANATGYQYSFDNGSNVTETLGSTSKQFGLNQDASVNIVWRAYVTYNSVNYFGAWSTPTRTVNAGRPQVRTQETQDIPFDAWADQERYYTAFGTVTQLDAGYLAANILVTSYQFRNLTTNIGSQITSATRSIVISKPGTNITLSGTPYVNNGWDSSVFTDYVDQRFRVDPQGTGWFNFNNASKLSGTIRFIVRPVTQSAVTYSIT
jgi:hypothetical protein